ncbi:formimidoylglutamate deiminase [Allonocardiopsis opalescens]|uniref:Formiminoglutamate deiminase n=1 Tax=Allonocardiopsis opalescens TaxID=1144618 RepID=A0A2T0PUH8_9ACTN|nr:formimidoylglutamate deiminase [Allonocardiopsis opalescens]PRX92551.1 formiminoglutamate deiminase [Allonocardiopsis opalescens]
MPGVTTRYWCEWALLGGEAAEPDVLLEVRDGRYTSVVPATPAPPGALRLPGLALPGLANAHSHAFHRALRGRSGGSGGDFWTWRERMYAVAERLDPDTYHRLARAVYAEMALAGITAVGEFHYLHHGPGGTRYADPNAMSAALVAAAADAGIRITLLDTCYLSGGIDAEGRHQPLEGVQRRFGDGDAERWAERVAAFRPEGEHVRVGTAAHSVRAVPDHELRRFTALHRQAGWAGRPAHIHVSEQPAENLTCLTRYDRTPVQLLADTGLLDELAPTLVHATHLGRSDVALIRQATAVICLCPTTERELADGLPSTGELFDAHPVVVGSDGNSTIDLFEEVRGVEAHERLRTGRRGNFTAPALLAGVFGSGHDDALGWPDAGALAPGNRADLVVLDLDGVRMAGADPARAADAVLSAATAADVREVMADGRWIVRDGVHQRLADVPGALRAAVREVMP